MSYRITFSKDRQKFSAGHFTLFPDGQVERLHGHNYFVSVSMTGPRLKRGLLFPFHLVKTAINRLCEAWDERVLLPGASEWVTIKPSGSQYEVIVQTSCLRKFYSFPREDVVVLDCNNISCENLTALFAEQMAEQLADPSLAWVNMDITIAESHGQSAMVTRSRKAD